MSRVTVVPPRAPRGPCLLVCIGGDDISLTISEATDLHRKLGEALLVAASRHGEVDPRIRHDEYVDPVDAYLSPAPRTTP